MIEREAKIKWCPYRAHELIMRGAMITYAASKTTARQANELMELVEPEEKNCIASRCMMWDKKRKDCGVKK